jgi:hypothetical protein
VPLIKAEAGAIKTRPERPGGLDVPNRDKLIYGRLEKDPPKSTTETLLPRPEVPLPPRAKPKPAPKAGKEPPAPKTPPAPTTLGASGEKAPPAAGLPLVALAKRKPAPTLPPAAPPLPRAEQKKPGKAVVAAIKPPPAAPPPPAPSPPAGEVAAPADGFLIQIAALRSAQAAREEWRRLSAKHNEILGGLKLVLVRADLGAKGIYFRLRAGPFRTRETAKDACLSLAERKIGCLVIRPGG